MCAAHTALVLVQNAAGARRAVSGGGRGGPVTSRRPEFPYAVSTMGGKGGSDTVAAAVSDVSAGSAGSAAGA